MRIREGNAGADSEKRFVACGNIGYNYNNATESYVTSM
jgi:hypothetical protein